MLGLRSGTWLLTRTPPVRSAKNWPRTLAASSAFIGTLFGAACSTTEPIQAAAASKSGFDGAVYKGTTVTVNPATSGATAYRVFEKGGSGFVSMASVRETAEQRATEFCDRKGKQWESLTETTASPPYILGNFPRIEIVFDCIDRPASGAPSPGQDKYARIAELKKLLDVGALTQEEFDREKAKILAQP